LPLIDQCIRPDWPAPANILALSTTRRGGCSEGVWRGLNLGGHVGDDASSVGKNRQDLSQLLPQGTRLAWLQQVHGTTVVNAAQAMACPEADAAWSTRPEQACVVMTADCLPVLLCNQAGTVVAAVHAGWRGLLDGVIESTVSAMAVPGSQLLAWLGPAIGPSSFEVGTQVREAFLGRAQEPGLVAACFTPVSHKPGHYLADIYQLARIRLQGLGVDGIYGGHSCTYSDAEKFYSYRRDGETGRQASLICIKPPGLQA
jgi:purine-nucleoside/S-methyl-5'-thioadenosine phosphorylase / adenosine deaminase